MNKFIISLTVVLAALSAQAQLAQDTYWIQFTDKNQTTYSLNQPDNFLSQRSIERRTRYNIAIDSLDFPVNSWYLDSIVNKGATVIHASKWMNGAAVYTTDALVLNEIYNLSFVDQAISVSDAYSMNFIPYNKETNLASVTNSVADYGDAFNQIDLHKGQVLHSNGFQGQGVQIAVIDAGFENLDQVTAFDSIFVNNQIIGTWDFSDNDTNVYDDHYHGKAVLSTIAANLPGEMLGTAPKAEFLLLRSEVAGTEFKIEEINWIVAAEFSDSVGVDVITTSLGYNNYTLPSNSYTWDDMDGQTSPMTIAANIAFDRGMFLVNSAGNEGNKSWKKITSPSDAFNTLTVGACNSGGAYADFSSRGNTADGRIKPDIVAQGESTTVITSSFPVTGNGTSYSTPLIAGLVACLWQVNIEKTNLEILELIRKHSHQYNNPDSIIGYGIPNFENAFNELSQNIEPVNQRKDELVSVFPTVFNNHFTLKYYSKYEPKLQVDLISVKGEIVQQYNFELDTNRVNEISINNLQNLKAGIYFVRVFNNHFFTTKKLIKV